MKPGGAAIELSTGLFPTQSLLLAEIRRDSLRIRHGNHFDRGCHRICDLLLHGIVLLCGL